MILCKFGRICATGNHFMRVWTNLCDRHCSYSAGNDFMRVWTNLCKRKHSYAAGTDFMWVCKGLCNRKCSYAMGKQFYASFDKPVWQEMFLYSWKRFCASNCRQDLHFEFSRQNLNRNVQIPSMCLCGDDSSHSQGQSGKRLLLASRGISGSDAQVHGSCIDPSYLSHTLDPTPDAPGG